MKIILNLKSRIISANKTKSQLIDRIDDLKIKNKNLSAELSTNESHVDSLHDRILIVEENYASGEQTRISDRVKQNESKKIRD